MVRISAPFCFGPLCLSAILLAFTPSARSQAPAAGASISVRMIDGIDSSTDPAGKQYRASVAKPVDAGNGVIIPEGAEAAVTLANSGNGSGWTTQLVSVTVNGQPVAVTAGAASVTSAAQSAAAAALGSMNSALGGFGRHIKAPTAATAVATGQRVVLPPGVTLTFALTQPLSATAPGTPASQPMGASSGPAPGPVSSPPVARAGQHWWLCRYVDPKDLNNAALGSSVYFSFFPAPDSSAASLGQSGGMAYRSAMVKHFIGYVRQNYKVTDLPGNPTGQYTGQFGGYCTRVQDDAASRANGRESFLKGWRTSHMDPIEADFADTPAQDAAIDAKMGTGAQPQPQPAPSGNSKECAYHATCSSQVPKL